MSQPLPEGYTYVAEFFPTLAEINVKPDTFEDVFDGIADECLELLYRKQVSYGPKNIESLGFFGVFDRLSSDKVERLRNAMNGKLEKGRITVEFAETLSDESIEDTLKDMVNYGLILIALKRGLWGLPLGQSHP
jgi:hypothetical protein